MKAIAGFPKSREVRLVDAPEARLETPSQARVQILDVGVCGTDREIAALDCGTPPQGSDHLVIDHEPLARVVGTGSGVEGLRPS